MLCAVVLLVAAFGATSCARPPAPQHLPSAAPVENPAELVGHWRRVGAPPDDAAADLDLHPDGHRGKKLRYWIIDGSGWYVTREGAIDFFGCFYDHPFKYKLDGDRLTL